MREIEAGLLAHLAADATTVCSCWRVVLKDGTVMGFTEHDHDLHFASTTFLAASGFAATNLETEEGLAASTSEVAGGFFSAAITEEALGGPGGMTGRRWRPIWLTGATHRNTSGCMCMKSAR